MTGMGMGMGMTMTMTMISGGGKFSIYSFSLSKIIINDDDYI